ncbi:MAG: hypothetical protein JST12_15265 [Armatimonadetes bacterium]|nr:hypothetical protein [Armatimonadota bacterium]
MVTAVLALMFAAKPQVTAWVVGYNPASVQRLAEHADQLSTIFMESYMVNADGMPARREANRDATNRARSIAKDHHIEYYAMINNYEEGSGSDGFDPVRMTKAVATEQTRFSLAMSLMLLAKEDKADGVDLDIESMKADDRDRYSAFVKTLARLLHGQKMKLSVTVHPKQEARGTWDGNQAQDYKAIGEWADRVNIMTYDFSWSSSPEGPIAPNDWVERVISFAKTQIDPKKIGMGIACYGYDWSTSPGRSVGWDDLSTKPTAIDPKSGEVVDGKLHFGGAESFRQKLDLATKFGVGSVAFWYCGSEDPAIWKLIPNRE